MSPPDAPACWDCGADGSTVDLRPARVKTTTGFASVEVCADCAADAWEFDGQRFVRRRDPTIT